jgi:hypothetical protein
MESRIMKYTKEMLEDAVANSTSFAGVLRYLNAGLSGSVHGHLKKRIVSYGIDHSHFIHSKGNCGGGTSKKTTEEILILIPNNVTKRNTRRHLLYAMLSSNVEYVCSITDCPNPSPEWRGEKLTLEIDHIDGNWRNCLLDNLRFVCPNCHSQTFSNTRSQAISGHTLDDFYSGVVEKQKIYDAKKSKKCLDCSISIHGKSVRCRGCQNKVPKKNKIEYPALEALISSLKISSYLAVSKELSVSDNAIRKHLRRNGIDPKTLKPLNA